ncbi:MAG: TIGR00730 family Rossman fold protein [Bradymonadia bacterium]
MRSFRSIAVYCGSSNAVDPAFMSAAREVGTFLARQGVTVVYGGGNVGTMGAVADGALESGGRVIGVITEKLQDLEVGHIGLSELHIVETMSQRKNRMIELSDAFIALPGGFGTLEEFAETISLAVLNYHDKPTGLLNLRGFYDHLFSFIEHAQIEGFIRRGQEKSVVQAATIDTLYERLQKAQIAAIDDWL